tara:strand:+ start:201 stop:728 length:528 start_codon:yes stop_codon:yes gene_type:complete
MSSQLKHTKRKLSEIGAMLRKALQDELVIQKHVATGRLSRGLKYHVRKLVLNINSSVTYWKAVNNPRFAKKPNIEAIKKWVITKGLNPNAAYSIFNRLNKPKSGKFSGTYGRRPYIYWKEGNYVPRRTDFAGYVANKQSEKIASELAPSIGIDVANMIAKQIRKNNPKTKVTEQF